ncbi:hypothetical protein CHGG_05096 [Chaetomium globosum CBS 148.51]|uniref:DUF4419 domain-containing protein n=1 Tax=Chaetomium globosum (strain ATCC 6205 / CBS 148.51 / DSM 1962 / NBRC 6347 / NRRL 1970) TaxID=306901 RepID=Q2GZF0_CHAGB|nr:uncharacterized protein CHGG_05096 [Chaetomium globosum CBS 148.51]EAQ88477.1 hypothetical protein CHGG_05096 [Chaetomium globosum CBS 148.51]
MTLLSILTLAGLATGSVVILPGGTPKPLLLPAVPVAANDYDSILRTSAASGFPNSTVDIILSSYSGTLGAETANATEIFPSSDSFIHGAIQAWGEHLHLELRPEEVWFTVLAQLNFYMDANAEKVRHLFVKHEGQETIVVEDTTWTRVLLRFKDEIQARVQTDWLREWIMPGFSTTTKDDEMTANILMMGLMKAYFKYVGGIICGLPSVTLLGEKEDWEKLQAKLERLAEFGEEPTAYQANLVPIFKRFVKSFDEPDSEETREFWSHIVFAKSSGMCGSAPLELSGWISGFLFWDTEGKRLGGLGGQARKAGLTMDGVDYIWHDIRKLPVGYGKAPFTMLDFRGMKEFPAYVSAGTLGKRLVKGPPVGYEAALTRAGQDTALAANASAHGTIRPLSAWMVYGPLDSAGVKVTDTFDMELQMIASRANANLNEGRCGAP